jgi:hypothetical protein
MLARGSMAAARYIPFQTDSCQSNKENEKITMLKAAS